MFNRSLTVFPTQRSTEYVTQKITVKRAPTDESVRLLREMEQAATDKVIESVKVGDTTFQCVVHTMREAVSGDRIYRAIFSLNGKKMTAEHRVRELDGDQRTDMLALRDNIAREIATHILIEAHNGR